MLCDNLFTLSPQVGQPTKTDGLYKYPLSDLACPAGKKRLDKFNTISNNFIPRIENHAKIIKAIGVCDNAKNKNIEHNKTIIGCQTSGNNTNEKY